MRFLARKGVNINNESKLPTRMRGEPVGNTYALPYLGTSLGHIHIRLGFFRCVAEVDAYGPLL